MSEFTHSFDEDVVQNAITYDEQFKRVFCRKDVLAGILINIIPEYKDLTHSQVMNLIKTSEFAKINAEVLNGDDVDFDKKIIYDVVIKTKLPNSDEEVQSVIFFDLEMQRRYNKEYPLLHRAIYYTSRLLAKQLKKGDSYKMLRPVYSTWICLQGTPSELQNSVCSFRLAGTNNEGKDVTALVQASQLINIDLVMLSEDYDWDQSDAIVIKYLQSILKNRLQDRSFNPYLDCNNASLLKEVQTLMSKEEEWLDDIKYERQEARKEGRAEGRAEARAEALGKHLRALLGLTNNLEQTLTLLQEEGYTKEEVEVALKQLDTQRG